MKLNAAFLSIKLKLTITVPLGALTKKRIGPVVEIEPLKLVPAGREYCICDDEDERVKVGTVVAKAEEAINNVSRAANVAHRNNFVFMPESSDA